MLNVTQKVDLAGNVEHEMAPRGRPNRAEHLLLNYAASKPDPVIDLRLDEGRIARLAHEQGIQSVNVKATIDRLKKKDLAHLLQRGRYLLYPADQPSAALRLDALDPVAASLLRRLDVPYYLSWHAALWHHGLIDQQSRRISVALCGRKRDAHIRLLTVHFVSVAPRKFFGGETVENLAWPFNVAGVEKALIDSFDRPALAAPFPVVADALRRAWRDDLLNPERLVEQALRFGSPTLNRRIGFFMDLFEIPGAEELTFHLGRKHAVVLAPGREGTGLPVNKRWRVYEDPTIIGTALELK